MMALCSLPCSVAAGLRNGCASCFEVPSSTYLPYSTFVPMQTAGDTSPLSTCVMLLRSLPVYRALGLRVAFSHEPYPLQALHDAVVNRILYCPGVVLLDLDKARHVGCRKACRLPCCHAAGAPVGANAPGVLGTRERRPRGTQGCAPVYLHDGTDAPGGIGHALALEDALRHGRRDLAPRPCLGPAGLHGHLRHEVRLLLDHVRDVSAPTSV